MNDMPLYTKESLERLKEKIDLVEVLSRHIDMKKSGAAYKSHCPFHDEKTPSFMVQKGSTHYHCFGCGAHGDAIAFLMNHQKCSFGDAVTLLAEQFHVHLEVVEEKEEKGLERAKLKEALETASHFFQFYLLHTEEGKEALAYLQKRGLTLDFIRRFEIGLAPRDGSIFRQMMQKKKISEEHLLECGLLTKEKRVPFFRERITFPIHSSFGGVVGFSARKFHEETYGGKYINSPETPLFKKSKTLFGLNYSRTRIAKERKAIIVEGQIDCLRLIEAGLNLVVASLGTAFGEEHVKELQNLGVQEVIVLFDGDTSGENASSKVGDLFQKKGIEVIVVSLPEGSDPDSFLTTKGSSSLLEEIEKGVDYLSFQVKHLSRTLDLRSPAKKTALIHQLVTQIRSWEDKVMVHESLRKLAHLTQVPYEMLGVAMPSSPGVYVRRNMPLSMNKIDPHRILELDLLRWLILMGHEKKELVELVEKHLKPTHFWTLLPRKIFEGYMRLQANGKTFDLLSLLASINEEGVQECIDEILNKKVNLEKAIPQCTETIKKMLEREWLKQREEIKKQIQSGLLSDDELIELTKRFDELNTHRPVL